MAAWEFCLYGSTWRLHYRRGMVLETVCMLTISISFDGVVIRSKGPSAQGRCSVMLNL
jgi:hypothetical protein